MSVCRIAGERGRIAQRRHRFVHNRNADRLRVDRRNGRVMDFAAAQRGRHTLWFDRGHGCGERRSDADGHGHRCRRRDRRCSGGRTRSDTGTANSDTNTAGARTIAVAGPNADANAHADAMRLHDRANECERRVERGDRLGRDRDDGDVRVDGVVCGLLGVDHQWRVWHRKRNCRLQRRRKWWQRADGDAVDCG